MTEQSFQTGRLCRRCSDGNVLDTPYCPQCGKPNPARASSLLAHINGQVEKNSRELARLKRHGAGNAIPYVHDRLVKLAHCRLSKWLAWRQFVRAAINAGIECDKEKSDA